MPGDTVVVTVNGAQVGGSTVVAANGSWILGPVGVSLSVGQVLAAHSGNSTGPSGASVTVIAAGGPAVAGSLIPVPAAGATVLTVSGNPGETITVVDQSTGQVLGSGTVQANGQVAVFLTPAPSSGDVLKVISNGIQEASSTVGAAGPAPVVIQGAVLVEGSVLTGTGVPGALIQVVDDQGHVLGSTTVAADGSWAASVSGAVAGVGVKVIQDGVAVSLSQVAAVLGNERVFLSQNVFKPLQGGSLDVGFKAIADEHVTVKIFNLAGETVRLAAEMDVKAGVLYALKWNGQNEDGQTVAAGVYIVSVFGPNTRILKKVVVLK